MALDTFDLQAKTLADNLWLAVRVMAGEMPGGVVVAACGMVTAMAAASTDMPRTVALKTLADMIEQQYDAVQASLVVGRTLRLVDDASP